MTQCFEVTDADLITGYCRRDTCSAKASILLTWCQRVLTTATLQSPVQLVFCCCVKLLLATC